jgi:predicted GNAT superfamily acetyltransferase
LAASQEAPVIAIRKLHERSEFEEAVRLQRKIWGFADVELLPVRVFIVAIKVGGQAYGAFDGDRMIGFLLAIPGLKPGGKYYLHSHMLGVLPQYRNEGVGRMLKLAQRTDALARGIDLIEWTFDPLEIKNAYFNLERLGAVARRYVPNQYGTTSSHLHGGLPTDRLVAEWYVAAPRTEAVLNRQPVQRPLVEARIAVPNSISDLRKTDPARASAIQRSMAEEFRQHFDEGLAVIGMERSADSGTYLLGQFPS